MLMEDVERMIEKREGVVARKKTEREEKGKFWSESAAAAVQPLPPCPQHHKRKERTATQELLSDFDERCRIDI
jgi:hypothetical protein